ncbi:hypothetical protein, partial [Winslowiella toletana]|uniref:hypothetical protein n=1 Tax=Winslowiella toletana TaxID=92490 RepID=UPI0019D70000
RDNVASGNGPQGEAFGRVILHDPPNSEKSTLWVLFLFPCRRTSHALPNATFITNSHQVFRPPADVTASTSVIYAPDTRLAFYL